MSNHEHRFEAGPHRELAGDDPRERFLAELFDRLWGRYRERVGHVRTYEEVVRAAGGRFVNDHIAFRTFTQQEPAVGTASLTRPFVALGYRLVGCYEFPDKHLSAVHLQHENPEFPKLFVSELRTWELGTTARDIVSQVLVGHRAALSDEFLVSLREIEDDAPSRGELLDHLVDWVETLPWPAPQRHDVDALNAESQYGAWVLVHGYAVNHFTALVNSHGVEGLADIERTADALRAAGVPMKETIEGDRGSKLRQTATAAANVEVDVMDGELPSRIEWSYAYFELAERGQVPHAETGEPVRFEGFLGPQATELFDMTRR